MYEKQNFTDGSVLAAEQLNRMETGIAEAHDALPQKLTRPATAQVGDYLRIKAIGADGTMEVEAVPAPTGGNIDLSGYATEVWVQELLAEFPSFQIEVVQELPATGEEKTIYLVPFADDSGSYLEYLYVNGSWEVVGNGKDSGENAVQSSWAQNDPTQPDYVKDRTHWEENSQTVIEYDGGSDGREVFPIYGGDTDMITKISDLTPNYENLIGAEFTAGTADGKQAAVLTEDIAAGVLRPITGGLLIAEVGVVAYGTTLTRNDGETFTVPSPGVYSTTLDGGAGMYIAKLTYGSTIVHPLADKWIPDSIARVGQIPSDEHIKSLIDTALGVIENGTY